MTKIIDARITLPREFWPYIDTEGTRPAFSQYDVVLNVCEKLERSYADLLKDMETEQISHGIIHAEYAYGDPADQLNEAVAKLVHENESLFSGVGTISMERLQPMRAVKQLETIKQLGLIGVNIQPAFF